MLKKIRPKAYWREIIALLMLLLAIVFFRSERRELLAIVPHIQNAKPLWLLAGVFVTALYIIFQAGIYRKSFSAIGSQLNWGPALVLFLKRNFISVFLPAGGVSSLAYSPSQIRKLGFNQAQIHQASGLFGFASLLTVFIAGLPVVVFTVFSTNRFQSAWWGLLAIFVLILLLFLLVRSIRQKGRLYQWIDKRIPSFTPTINELFAANVNTRQFLFAIASSIGVELTGMAHVFIAMLALGAHPSFGAAAAAYIISVLMMVISPFLRGLGAVELLMVYVLGQFGYDPIQSLSITILYRVFEFWLPLLTGLIVFCWKGRALVIRVAPAFLAFALGLINIISVVTPPIRPRVSLLREYLPLATIHASNLLVLFVGLALLVTSAFLLKGLRNAWIIALGFSLFSLIGHLTKALDYEEASIALVTIIALLAASKQYTIKSSNKWMRAGLRTAVISTIAVMIFAFTSFYFIDKKHFGVDFTWGQSLEHTFRSFLLVDDPDLHPITRFGREFIWVVRMTGILNFAFLVFTILKPYRLKPSVNENAREKAKFLLSEFGSSSVDHFKIAKDKLFFLSDLHEAFIAYRISGSFAIVLEDPVCADENKVEVLLEFDRHCRKMGLKSAFYRVDENSMPWYDQLKKNKLMIGQEAILDVKEFTLEGRDKKSLRNGLNFLQKNGFSICILPTPQEDELLMQLKMVSDQWLENYEKTEKVFSQGMFDRNELKFQDIIAVKDVNGQIKAFLNIIPDYAEDECTYDLIRKTADAPAAAMDALIIRLIEYAREKGKEYVNLGLAPMTGITIPDNTAEQLIKLAADKIRRFQHYKGLREFKGKYASLWENKYLIYDNDFDLIQLPIALNTVMKP